jgi:hypothetical protein
MRATIALVALALLLAGCGRVGIIDYTRLEPGYRQQQFAYAAAGRDLMTEVQGNPFAMPQAAFDAAVTEAMQGAHFGPATNFTTTPGETARPGYRVRLLFNGPAASTGAIVCTGQPPGVSPSSEGGNVRLLAAFCHNQYPLSYLSARIRGVTDAQDPAFRRFMRQVTTNLFPPQNREEQEHRCIPPGAC